jgi:hypothetical protein
LKLAIVCSAHGFGHLGRQLALLPLLKARASVRVFTAVPEAVVHNWAPDVQVVPWFVDVGLRQLDSIREDPEGTLPLLEQRCSEEKIDLLAAQLRGVDACLVDVAPAGLEAARRAGCRTLAMGNFDWAWIYRHYPVLSFWAERFAGWQAGHQGLSLWPGPGLQGFAATQQGGLLARRAERAWRGPLGKKTVLVCFGGFGLADLETFLPVIPGVVYLLAPPMPRLDRPDCIFVDDVPFPELLLGADVVFTKPGYGILGECLRAGVPMVFQHRAGFPEAPYLEAVMWSRGDVALQGSMAEALARIWSQQRPEVVDAPVERVGERVRELLGF